MAVKTAVAVGSSLAPPIRLSEDDWRDGYLLLRESVAALLRGASNAIGLVTIESGDSPLTVLDERCTAQSIILVMLQSQELAQNFDYSISDVSLGSFVITFDFSGQLPPTVFRYLLQG